MTLIDPDGARGATKAVPGLPRDAEGPVFREPWEAQTFAMTLALHDRGLFTRPDWVTILAAELKDGQSADEADTGLNYYRHWLAALQGLLAEKGVTDPPTLARYRNAWDRAAGRTVHGAPIELGPQDFG